MENIPKNKLNKTLTLKQKLEKKAEDEMPVLDEMPEKVKKPRKPRTQKPKKVKSPEPRPIQEEIPLIDEETAKAAEEALEKEEVRLDEVSISKMLEEDEKRLAEIRLVGIDQKTGEGIPTHTEILELPDYPIKKQWLTTETMNTNIYSKVKELGSIAAYVEYFNTTNAERLKGEEINADDVTRLLMLVRMRTDPAFAFITSYVIIDKFSGDKVPFRLNYAQHVVLNKLEEMRRAGKPIRLVLLKARQWGGSTLVQLYMSWIQLFLKEGWNSVILAQTKDTAKRIKAMYTLVLDKLKGADVIFGTKNLKFSPKEKSTADSIVTDASGNKVRDNDITIASFENYESTRGANFSLAHFSEVAYWVNTPGKTAEGVITNILGGMGVTKPLSLMVLESTANGMSGFFYDMYQIAKNPNAGSAFEAMFIPFFYILNDTIPFRNNAERKAFAVELVKNRFSETDSPTSESGAYLFSLWKKGATLEAINWYIRTRASFHDHASVASEAPSDDVECFKHSGHTIFDQYLVSKYANEYSRAPEYKGEIVQPEGQQPRLAPKDDNGNLWIWQYADNNPTENRYLVVVDVGGRHKLSDFSVITVVDRWPLRFGGKAEVVARWRGHIRYDFLAYKAVMIARMYCNALLVFESNTFDKKKGEATEFVEYGDHTRGILSTIEDDYDNLYMRASTSPEDIRQGRFRKIGFNTNGKTKQEMVDHFIVTFEDNIRFLEPDFRAYEEMAIYEQREDGSYGNIVGKDNHDDILMTDMIADLISDSMPMPSIKHETFNKEYVKGTVNESLI